MLAGVRGGRPDWLEAGARAQLYAAQHAPDRSSVFESMLMASGYNLLRTRAPAAPTFAAQRGVWENYLRDVRPLFDAHLDTPYMSSNKHLVEAVLSLELARSGLRSPVRGTALHDPKAARRRGLDILNRLVRERVALLRGQAAGHRITALSDRFAQPLAYHDLVVGFLARALDLAGRRASAAARDALRIGVRTVWAFQSPDGDVAYFGRSQGQSWAPAFAAFAAERAAGRSCDAQARDFHGVTERAMQRLATHHPIGPAGMAIVPSANGPATVAAIDDYASDVVYNGLTLTALGWAADGFTRRRGCRPAGLLSDRRHASARLPFESARFATLRRGRVWIAVRQSSLAPDGRSAFGLRAAKYRDGRGAWVDLLPAAPRAAGTPAGTFGPLLVRRSGRLARPRGYQLRIERGRLLMRGGWMTAAGRWVRKDVTFRFVPTERGVRIVVPTRRGDRIVYSALTAGRPQRVRRGVAGATASTRASGRPRVRLQGPFASSSSLDVWRADLSVRAGGRRVTFRVRAH